MSGKKKKTDDISHNPFKALKGLSVSDAPKAQKPKPEAAEPGLKKDIAREDPRLFEEEMGGMGVKRLDEDDDFAVDADQTPVKQSSASTEEEPAELDDAELFKLAVNGVDRVFKDEWPEEEAGSAAPRRRKQLRLGQLKPEAQLDLHGMTRDEALDKVRFFLENAHHHGFRVVLIITGKGARSGTGPVLRTAVLGLLERTQDRVLEWVEAPRQYGGSGAVVVFLRKQ